MTHNEDCHNHGPSCHAPKRGIDKLLWGSIIACAFLYFLHLFGANWTMAWLWLHHMAHAAFDLLNTMWWGIVLGVIMLSLLSRIPREFVMAILGPGGGMPGILRATAAGVFLDLCNHGILMVGAKLYERGASAGQMVAFLVASPWNSFSLTLVMIALIGLSWTLAFIVISMVIAVLTGLIFERLVKGGKLPANPNSFVPDDNFRFWSDAKTGLKATQFDLLWFKTTFVQGLRDSRMVLRWIFFGVVLAAVVRGFVDESTFSAYFGPTVLGLGATLLAATVLEVCSEGSTPLAADLLSRAGAPGNSFSFLMAGVATDYTEIAVVQETTSSWKIALFLPLITIPQIVGVGLILNMFAG